MKYCIFCGVEVKKNVTTPGDLYGVPLDEPGATWKFWDGGYYCPECRAGNCFVEVDENGKPIPNNAELSRLRDWFGGGAGNQRPPFPALASLLGIATSEPGEPVDTAGMKFYEVKGLSIREWYPLPGGGGRPEQVHLHLEVEGIPYPIILRLKSRRLVDELTAALTSHAMNVWGKGGS